MGGDTVPFPASSSSSSDDDELSIIKQQSLDPDHFSDTFEIEANERRIKRVYAQVFKNYDESKNRAANMEEAKSKILSYTPGSWVENVGGMTINDYNVPKTTTLLLIGPKGSGKSSLINRISRVFEDDKFAPERAQVTYNSSVLNGTFFLHEYMIPRTSTSFCLYDTCSLSDDLSENLNMIKRWMTKGVRHRELVERVSDGSSFNSRKNLNARQDKLLSYERRTVNFVIFVVNGLSVLKCVDSNGVDTQYTQMVAKLFSSLFLSFKDHKPAIAITHGDLLSLSECARVRVYLGELLGVHPSKQTFDIPDNCEPTTELSIVDLIRYGLEHADRNLPCKVRPTISKGSTIQLWSYLLLLFGLGMFISTLHLQGFHSLKHCPKRFPEPAREIKKVMDIHPENGPELTVEIKDVMEVHPENVSEPEPEIKEVHPENVSEPAPEIKEVLTENNPKRNMKIKKVQAERPPEKAQKIKKFRLGRRVPEPIIDWKKIRHIW